MTFLCPGLVPGVSTITYILSAPISANKQWHGPALRRWIHAPRKVQAAKSDAVCLAHSRSLSVLIFSLSHFLSFFFSSVHLFPSYHCVRDVPLSACRNYTRKVFGNLKWNHIQSIVFVNFFKASFICERTDERFSSESPPQLSWHNRLIIIYLSFRTIFKSVHHFFSLIYGLQCFHSWIVGFIVSIGQNSNDYFQTFVEKKRSVLSFWRKKKYPYCKWKYCNITFCTMFPSNFPLFYCRIIWLTIKWSHINYLPCQYTFRDHYMILLLCFL